MVNVAPVCQLQLSSPLRHINARDGWGNKLFERRIDPIAAHLIFAFSRDEERHSLNMLNKAWFMLSRENGYWYTMSQYSGLEPDQSTRKINSVWLKRIVQAPLTKVKSCFPWIINGQTKIGQSLYGVGNYFFVTNQQPAFLINIPIGHMCTPNGPNNDYTKITSVLERLQDESFGNNATESRSIARNRLAVVIGINQLESMNPAVNYAFANYIFNIPKIKGILYRAFGFFWDAGWELARWICSELENIPDFQTKIYNLQDCYNTLERLGLSEKAQKIREELEWSPTTGLSKTIRDNIPYHLIRETILKSRSNQQLAKALQDHQAAPAFYVTMDPDFLRLRTTTKGYFDWYLEIANQTLIKKKYTPSVMSLGYQLDATTPPVARLAVKCDMVVRDATNLVIPGAVYLPEPGTAYCISEGRGIVHNIATLSFIDPTVSNVPGRALESRRLINNGIRAGIINRDRIVFNSNGALITAMPDRMYTEKCRQYKTLSRTQLKRDGVLNALREISQVHFNPIDWAHSVYHTIPSEAKTGQGRGIFWKLSGFMSNIYSSFDPISLIDKVQERFGRSKSDAFDLVMTIYQDYSDELFKHAGTDKRKTKTSRGEIIDQLVDASLENVNTLKLNLRRCNLSAEWRHKIVRASYESGKAFFNVLKNFNG